MVVFMKNIFIFTNTPIRRRFSWIPFFGSITAVFFSFPQGLVLSARLQPRFVFPFSVVFSSVSVIIIRIGRGFETETKKDAMKLGCLASLSVAARTQNPRLFPRIVSAATSTRDRTSTIIQGRAAGFFMPTPVLRKFYSGSDDEILLCLPCIIFVLTICSCFHVGSWALYHGFCWAKYIVCIHQYYNYT